MLELTPRPAKIGASINNTRTEKHGDDNVAALDIPLSFVLEPDELCNLLRNEEAAHRLFEYNRKEAGMPAFKHIGAITLKEKIEGCRVTLKFDHLEPVELVLVDATCKSVRVEPLPMKGGRSTCYMTVQTTPDLDEGVMALLAAMNSEVEFSLVADGYNSQQELSLDEARAKDIAEGEQEAA